MPGILGQRVAPQAAGAEETHERSARGFLKALVLRGLKFLGVVGRQPNLIHARVVGAFHAGAQQAVQGHGWGVRVDAHRTHVNRGTVAMPDSLRKQIPQGRVALGFRLGGHERMPGSSIEAQSGQAG